LAREKKKIKNNFGEGYTNINHGDAESPGIEKSGFLKFISKIFLLYITEVWVLNII